MKMTSFFLVSILFSTVAFAVEVPDYDCIIMDPISGKVLAKGAFLMSENGQQYLKTSINTQSYGKAFIELRMGSQGHAEHQMDDFWLQLSVSDAARSPKKYNSALSKANNSPETISVNYFSKNDQINLSGVCVAR